MKFLVICLNIVLLSFGTYSNVQDSLLNRLESSTEDSTKLDLLNQIALRYAYSDTTEARNYVSMAYELAKKIDHKYYIARTVLTKGNIEVISKNDLKAFEYYIESYELFKELENDSLLGLVAYKIGKSHFDFSNFSKAIDFYNEALALVQNTDNPGFSATIYNNIGNSYNMKGDYDLCLENLLKSLDIVVELKDSASMARAYVNIGSVYAGNGDNTNALSFLKIALHICQKIDMKMGIAYSSNNIGVIYMNMEEYDEALNYLFKSLEIKKELKMDKDVASSLNNIGEIYLKLGDRGKALELQEQALEIQEKIGHLYGKAYSKNRLAEIYISKRDFKKASDILSENIELEKEIGIKNQLKESYKLYVELYKLKNNINEAFRYSELYHAIKDSLLNTENQKVIIEMQTRYESEQKGKEIELLNKDKKLDMLEIARKNEEVKKQRTIIYSFVIGFLIIVVFSIFLIRLYLQKRKANIKLALQNTEIRQQKEEIEAQRDEIEAQRDEITIHRDTVVHQKEEIEASITYAKRIQTAVLPAPKYAESILGEHFIIFRPKDVVSGDFYWATRTDEWTVVTAADCTGHGVPGAFMSMLGVSFLNEIVGKKDVTTPAMVLDELRLSVIEALKQTGDFSSDSGSQSFTNVKDGMDMSIIAISNDKKRAQWSGANNPLYVVRNHELIEFKPDKMPVAVHISMDEFKNHEIVLQDGDQLYLSSDGFPDQFGGPKGKKFKYKPFKELLIKNSNLSMKEQGARLEQELETWMNWDPEGSGTGGENYEQIDDVTVVGIRI